MTIFEVKKLFKQLNDNNGNLPAYFLVIAAIEELEEGFETVEMLEHWRDDYGFNVDIDEFLDQNGCTFVAGIFRQELAKLGVEVVPTYELM